MALYQKLLGHGNLISACGHRPPGKKIALALD